MKILVIGAYGYTGQLICDELSRQSINFDVSGKSQDKLESFCSSKKISFKSNLIGDIKDDIFCDYLVDNYQVFINCAGPYNEESKKLLEKIANNSKKYIDLSGEVSFIKSSFETYNDLAKTNQSTIVHGCAFESLLMDLLAQKMIKKPIKNIYSFYWFNKHIVSPGTRITMKLAQYYDLFKINDYEWQPALKDDFCFTFQKNETLYQSVNYPLPEIVFNYWNYHPQKAQSFVFLPQNEVGYMGNRQSLQKPKSETYQKLLKRKKSGPTQLERDTHFSQLFLKVEFEDGTKKTVGISNKDMYQTTAVGVVLVLKQLLKSDGIFGIINPAKLFVNSELEALNLLNCQLINETILIEEC